MDREGNRASRGRGGHEAAFPPPYPRLGRDQACRSAQLRFPSLPASCATMHADLAATIARRSGGCRKGRFHLLGAEWPAPGAMAPPPAYLACRSRRRRGVSADAMPIASTYRSVTASTRARSSVSGSSKRLQFLVPLALRKARWPASGGFELSSALIRSWMDGNPPFRGPNWSSGIELAFE